MQMRKWRDRPHWEFDAAWLGADAHGSWLGVPRGTWLSRPGAGFHALADQVVLVPHDAWWMATFYSPYDAQRPVDVYVDIATPATWDGDVVTSVDLDLDVIRGATGRTWVDDEDEFAEHRVTLDYPEDLVAGALEVCPHVLDAVESAAAPFDGTALRWLAKLTS